MHDLDGSHISTACWMKSSRTRRMISVWRALRAFAQLKAHRLQREAKVARAMQSSPEGSADDWVRLAYDDVPERLWPVAKRSMLAHVERIQSLGGFNV